jgi:hypothetical protein
MIANLHPRPWFHGFAAVAFAGCATLPADPVEAALYSDLRKGADLAEDSGWTVDRVEMEAQAEDALHSLCQVEPATRASLDSWLTGQIAFAGGPAEQQFRDNGGDLDAAEDALEHERVRAVLRYAEAHAADDCPFWLGPDPAFRGVQGDADRLVLLGESGAFGSVVFEGSEVALGGGGSGRLLLGHGLGPQLTLAFGGEVGGTGAFVDDSDGDGRSLVTTFMAATPVLLRITRFSRVFDFEAAPVVRVASGQDLLPPGFATSVGVGFATMRSSSWMPYVVFFAGYGYDPPRDGAGASHSARFGTRVGIDLDP